MVRVFASKELKPDPKLREDRETGKDMHSIANYHKEGFEEELTSHFIWQTCALSLEIEKSSESNQIQSNSENSRALHRRPYDWHDPYPQV
jgi:hypothetical protein